MTYNKTELIQKIHSIGTLSNDEKAALIELLRTHKKYGLVWEDKPEQIEERLRTELPVLTEVKERAILSDVPNAPNHILIEGDNLEALIALTYTHEREIDIIYIDPPYNTGNKKEGAFIYNDNIVESEDSYIHSKWLSFMKRRLSIAKLLLKPDGVLFISIGDDEVANLKLLCDELFSPIAIVPRIAKKGSNQGTWFRPTKDYVLVYANDKNSVQGFSRQGDDENNNRTYPFTEENTGRKYRKAHSLFQASLDPLRGCINQRYYIEAPDGTLILPPGPNRPLESCDGARIVPQTSEDKVWRWSKDSYMEKKDLIMFDRSARSPLIDASGNHTDWNVYEKKYEDEESIKEDDTLPDDVIYDFINSLGTSLLNDMGIKFPFSKPCQLIEYLISITNKDRNIKVLDFFAGSGTTLHATMRLNEKDEGSRQCICVTNNESNICEEVTYKRIFKAINGYTTPRRVDVGGLKNNNLHYFKTGFVDRERTPKNMRALMSASSELLCIKNDLFKESDTLAGRKLNKSIARYFNDGKKQMLIVFNEEAIPAIADTIAAMDFSGKMLVYVFSPGNYPFEDEFVNVLDKVELCALPAAIYNAYLKVLPKKRRVLLPEAQEENTEAGDGEELNLNFEEA